MNDHAGAVTAAQSGQGRVGRNAGVIACREEKVRKVKKNDTFRLTARIVMINDILQSCAFFLSFSYFSYLDAPVERSQRPGSPNTRLPVCVKRNVK